ncbi:carboxypeptidase-like regulatory domain-containing protein [Haloarchaeobius litoreus]|uniref:Carboxypeptidase regulatory-like domain-containing protein n=1 Tax=Haloarchaeobius litoreus TaxID=755306 RepID=A0ABD6DHP5_9EURY|nr:carboxypeptidase-like regulatory domain-containing protein [Haloarchaeobius litoreus]
MSWGTRATALLALAVLVATVAGVGAATTAATATEAETTGEASVALERTGADSVDVTIDIENGSADLSNVTLTVAETGASTRVELEDGGLTDYEATTSVTALTNDSTDTDLSAATVTVTNDGTTIGEDSVDLRYAALDGASATFGDGALRLERVDLRGFAPGASVRATIGNTALTATYDAEGDALTVPTADLSALDRESLFADRQVRVVPNGTDNVTASTESVTVADAAESASVLVTSGDTVAIANPLLSVLDVETYHLDLTTESPDGQFVGPVEATDAGVELPRSALAASVNATLSVGDADGPRLLDGWESQYASEPVDVTVDRSYFAAERDGVSSVLVQRDGGVARYGVSWQDGHYAVENGTALPADQGVLLVVEADGERTVVSAQTVGGTVPGAPNTSTANQSDGNGGDGAATTTTTGTATNASVGGGFLPASYRLGDWLLLVAVALLCGIFGTVILAVVRFFAGAAGPNGDPTNPRGAAVVLGFGGLIGLIGCAGTAVLLLGFGEAIDLAFPLLIGVAVGGLAALAFAALLSWLDFWRFGEGAGTTTPDPVDVKVTLVDGNGHRIREDADVVAKPTRGAGSKTTRSTDSGVVSMSLLPGGWQLTAAVGTQQRTDQLDVEDGRLTGEQAQLAFPRPGVRVTITDKQDGEPIPGARVAVEPDEGDDATARTGRNGRASVTLPYAASTATVRVEHPKYHTASNDCSLADDGPLELNVALGRKTGRLSVTAEVDGVATEGLPVSIAPAGDDRYRVDERQGSRRTDGRGRVRASEVFVGDYVVGLDVAGSQSDLFRTRTTEVAIHEDEPTNVTVEASFEWTVPQATRDRVRRLRREVDGLSEQSGRDTAFPGYYGSVVSRLLDLVEALPQYGHLFATGEHRPDDVAEALLDAAEDGISRVNTAMTTKRNVDMFAACSDMASVDPRWDGDVLTHEAYFDYVDADVDSDLTGRIERTRSRIDDERGDLTEVEPATEMWEHARELFQETRREREPLAKAARALLVAGLLDAVEHGFDRRELRERMKRTVF